MNLYQPSGIPGLFLQEDNPLFTNLLYQGYLGNIPEDIESYIGQRPSSVSGIMNLYSPQGFSGAYRQFSPEQIQEAGFEVGNQGIQKTQPQGLESLLAPYNLSSQEYRMFTQGREPTQIELRGGDAGGPTKELGETYADLGKPSFLGFTGDLGAQTGRTIRVDSNRGDDVITRPETYKDVLGFLQKYRSQQGA